MAMKDGAMFERHWLAHFIHNGTAYQRLGEDLEELTIALNPEEETKQNILGASTTRIKGYKPQYDVSTFYARYNDPLFEKLKDAVNNRSTGDDLKTTVCDILLSSDGEILDAWVEDVFLIPQSYGGDTTGVQIPFQVKYMGNRKDVTAKASISDGVLTIAE